MLRPVLAVLHLLALGIGLGAVWARARALATAGGSPPDPAALRRAFAADGWWGLAALLWIATGLWRAVAGTEKAPAYYVGNHIFWAKMGLLGLVFALELWPMITLIRWRRAGARVDGANAAAAARRISRISDVQAVLVVAMVAAAALMARGYGSR